MCSRAPALRHVFVSPQVLQCDREQVHSSQERKANKTTTPSINLAARISRELQCFVAVIPLSKNIEMGKEQSVGVRYINTESDVCDIPELYFTDFSDE